MHYHALALAGSGGHVDLVGLEGAPVHHALGAVPRVRIYRLADGAFRARASRGGPGFVWRSAARVLLQTAALLFTLLRLPKPDLILVQNPPAVPALAIPWIVARLRGARLVIDWHNLSHSVLAVRLGDQHSAVRALARAERRWAQHADGHMAVSSAMADWLWRTYRVRATVVYDRPAQMFQRPSRAACDDLWQRLAPQLQLGSRPVPLVVAPTSWTPDEDFDLLLAALERAERTLAAARARAGGACLAVLLTGRGELRVRFEERVARRRFTHIAVRTLWLDPGDYPVLVGMADAGLCLHQSSSGLDLPMKLADLRGAGVPVCAFDYGPVLAERSAVTSTRSD